MSHSLKTDAFVMRKRELLQKDILISLFTKELGKVTVIAKGIKSMTSRRGPHLQTGNLIKVIMNVKNDYKYLQQTELISGFSNIKDDAKKTEYLYLYFFIIDRLLPDGQQENDIFRLTRAFLSELSRSEQFGPEEISKYLNMMLRMLGYAHEEKRLIDLILLIEETIHEKIPFHII
ncbi:MAG: hypothetical protein RI947_371 [Candidatus Parcubacteria bacterium]